MEAIRAMAGQARLLDNNLPTQARKEKFCKSLIIKVKVVAIRGSCKRKRTKDCLRAGSGFCLRKMIVMSHINSELMCGRHK